MIPEPERTPPEIIGVVGSGASWASLIVATFQVSGAILTVIVTAITLYMIWPAFWKKFRRDGFIPQPDAAEEAPMSQRATRVSTRADPPPSEPPSTGQESERD